MNKRKYSIYFMMIMIFLSQILYSGPLTDKNGNLLTKDSFEAELRKVGVNCDISVDVNVEIKVPQSANPYIGTTKYGSDEVNASLWATVIKPTKVLELNGPQPTILITTAYRREIMVTQSALLVNYGYNVVMIDNRGTGSSQGHWYSMGFIEQYDIKYIIDEWIPSQEWSDGKVGMVGGSYMAICQLLAAGIIDCNEKGEPIHLKACIPAVPGSDTFGDIAVHGGTFELEFMGIWMSLTEILNSVPGLLYLGRDSNIQISPLNLEDLISYSEMDINEAREEWLNSMRSFPEPFYDFILSANNEIRGGTDMIWQASPMIYWPVKPEGGYTIPSELKNESERVIPQKLPILLIGGWYDIFLRGTLNQYNYGLSNHSVSDKGLIVGEWYHAEPFLNIGMGVPAFSNMAFHARWFDWKIRGKNDPFMVNFPVLLKVMGLNKWRAEKSWPLPESRLEKKTLYLSKQKRDPIQGDWFTSDPDNQLYSLVFDKSEADLDSNNPIMKHNADPGCLHGGNSRSSARWSGGLISFFSQFLKNDLGFDYDDKRYFSDERSDDWKIPTFTTEPLKEDMEVVGPLTLRFWSKTDFKPLSIWGWLTYQPTIDIINSFLGLKSDNSFLERTLKEKTVQWVCEVNDVFPDGRAKNITSGWLRASRRPYDPNRLQGVMINGKIEHPVDPDYTPHDPFYFRPTEEPKPINEGELYEYVIELWPTCNVFKKGHRLRLTVTGSDFPHLMPILRPSWNEIVIDENHEARLDYTTTNNNDEGNTWKWITGPVQAEKWKPLERELSTYLMTNSDNPNNSCGCGTPAQAATGSGSYHYLLSGVINLAILMMVPFIMIMVRRTFYRRKRG